MAKRKRRKSKKNKKMEKSVAIVLFIVIIAVFCFGVFKIGPFGIVLNNVLSFSSGKLLFLLFVYFYVFSDSDTV